ncbi:uncharacterized protein STEHIDRAFT_140323 [Stereum hirsutum FP-91666 SS1]|uniref:uncharacterized protein n=1 Tax=Stereum hirsutum (strain FP-91666) TaxID=721885 RepID=UPI0004449495|nr:uncharacterized protein STEHIDRAFT_140323 [Stereum hirsutum FP-91666 SS1]EIM84743.1 hypothetical protein STEHIDRAFT_140323 [Stereum hirsutum FP-91666 SS1]
MDNAIVSGVPVDVWLKAVFGFDIKDLRLEEWNRPFSLSQPHLDAYVQCALETPHYRPFACMLMQAVLDYVDAMKDLGVDVHFPCGIYFDALRGYEEIYGSGGIKRKPDVFVTSEVGHALFQHVREVNEGVRKRNSDQFIWGHPHTAIEFKFERNYLMQRSKAPVTNSVEGFPFSAPMPAKGKRRSGGSTDERNPKRPKMTVIAEGEPSHDSVPAAFRYDRSGPPGDTLKTSLVLDEAQPADYAAEAMRSGLYRYFTCVFIKDDFITLWYFDRMGAIRSRGFRISEYPEFILYIAVAIARASLKDFGFEPMIVPAEGSTFPRPVGTYQWPNKQDELREQDLFARLRNLYSSTSSYEAPLLEWKDNVLRIEHTPQVSESWPFDTEPAPLSASNKAPPSANDIAPPSANDIPHPSANDKAPPSANDKAPPSANDKAPPSANDIVPPSVDDPSLSPTSTFPASTIDTSPPLAPQSSLTISFPITGPPIHAQPGGVGRGTVVYPLAPPKNVDGYDPKEPLVAKFSWQPSGRAAEARILRYIRKMIPARWRNHVTDVRCSKHVAAKATGLPRVALMEDTEIRVKRRMEILEDAETKKQGKEKGEPEEDGYEEVRDAFIGTNIEERDFHALVSTRYLPLKEVKDANEFMTVFKDVVKVHYVIYKTTGILHRDLSVNNVMFIRRNGRVFGVLNDWDLAAPEVRSSPPTAFHRTGTAAFMALNLLDSPDGSVPHLYCYDLESFAWILVWCAYVLLFNGKEVTHNKRPEKIQEWTEDGRWEAISDSKYTFITKKRRGPSPSTDSVTPGMKGLLASCISPVIAAMHDTFHRRRAPGEEQSPSYPLVKDDFFVFSTFMRVLEPDVPNPEEAVFAN